MEFRALDIGLLFPVRYLLETILSGDMISTGSCKDTLFLNSAKCYLADGFVCTEDLG